MTYIINTPSGGTASKGNLGIAPQQFDFKRIIGGFIVPEDGFLTAAEIASQTLLKAALQTKTTANDRTARWFPFYGVTDFAASDVAPQEWTSGYGEKEMTGDGTYSHILTFRRGGLMRHANFRQFNDETVRVIYIDKEGNLLGTLDGSGQISGISTEMYTPKFTMAGNSDPALYQTSFSLTEPSEINDLDKIAFVTIGQGIKYEKEVPGVVNIYMVAGTVAAASIPVAIFTKDGNVDMSVDYATELADADNFSVTKVSDGTAVTVSTVTLTSGEFVLGLAAYTGAVIVTMAGPTTLASNSVGGAPDLAYECYNTLAVTLPAP